MKKYCEECGKEVNTQIVSKEEEYMVCGEKIIVNAQVMICSKCEEEFYNEELDNTTLIKAYNKYRQNHKLLMPDEIKDIREYYGLSQRGFAKLLNWGDKTIHRYENGSLQDKAHNSLLLFLRNPQNMQEYIINNEINLEDTQKEKLLKRIENILKDDVEEAIENELIERIFKKTPSAENGFKSFDYEKFYSVVLFFANKCEGILKVKLLKLLNYSDMIFYKENGISLTGTQYIHLPYGPVPQHFNVLFGMMEAQNIIKINIQMENGYESHQVIPGERDYISVLSPAELDVLQRIYIKFESYSSSEISNYSHQEAGYKATNQGETISYEYAKEISF